MNCLVSKYLLPFSIVFVVWYDVITKALMKLASVICGEDDAGEGMTYRPIYSKSPASKDSH